MRTTVVYLVAIVVASTSPFAASSQVAPTDIITNTTRMEIPEWNATRGCQITPEAEGVLLVRMQEVTATIETKRVKYNPSPFQERTMIKGIAYAYLDEATVSEFGPNRRNCRLNAAILAKYMLPPVATNPDTGVLDVDGSRRGADIYIDGVKKGNIRQAFILSVGPHRWKTMKCEEQVEIAPNGTKKVHCNKS